MKLYLSKSRFDQKMLYKLPATTVAILFVLSTPPFQ